MTDDPRVDRLLEASGLNAHSEVCSRARAPAAGPRVLQRTEDRSAVLRPPRTGPKRPPAGPPSAATREALQGKAGVKSIDVGEPDRRAKDAVAAPRRGELEQFPAGGEAVAASGEHRRVRQANWRSRPSPWSRGRDFPGAGGPLPARGAAELVATTADAAGRPTRPGSSTRPQTVQRPLTADGTSPTSGWPGRWTEADTRRGRRGTPSYMAPGRPGQEDGSARPWTLRSRGDPLSASPGPVQGSRPAAAAGDPGPGVSDVTQPRIRGTETILKCLEGPHRRYGTAAGSPGPAALQRGEPIWPPLWPRSNAS